MSKEELKEVYDRYILDPGIKHLQESGIRFVPGSGPLEPRLMIVGEAPGKMENAKGQPFVGPAGKELTDILVNLDIDPFDDVFYTNIVKYWPRNTESKTRAPVGEEIEVSKPYLLEEINIVDPDFVVLCGRSAVSALFPEITYLQAHVGKLKEGKYIFVYHPAYGLHRPEQRHLVVESFEKMKIILDIKETLVDG